MKKFPPSPSSSSTTTPLTPSGYKSYLRQLSTTTTVTPSQTPPINSSTPSQQTPSEPTPTPTPTYPTTFAHIVSLITTGQPIPGIQEIPDTVLTGADKPAVASRRRKPWEVEGDTSTPTVGVGVGVAGDVTSDLIGGVIGGGGAEGEVEKGGNSG
ncbi:hypothetical protein FQN55_008341 [Onygenales sp. PD_40]|nr:hypothetical protein FQN55_008341 [Onygenales sp. PD_40]